MNTAREIDNRTASDMNQYLEDRVSALKRAQAIPLNEAMICLQCGLIMRPRPTCCGKPLSPLKSWLRGND